MLPGWGFPLLYVLNLDDSPKGSFAAVHPGLDVDDETCVCRQVAVKRPKELDLERKTLRYAVGETRPSGDGAAWDAARQSEMRADAARAFERERRLWTRLAHHPNVVEAHRAARLDGDPVLVLEYIHGAALAELISGPLPRLSPFDVVDLLRQGTNALDHLHVQGRIVHGDLSPGNVLYDGLGRVLLSDFGLSVPIGCERDELPRFQPAVSPPEHAAPRPLCRTVRDGVEVTWVANTTTPAGDVWRLAVLCLEALRGEVLQARDLTPDALHPKRDARAFTLKDPVAFASAALQIGLPEPAAATLRTQLGELFGAMLSPAPADRPEDGRALRQRLAALESPLKDLVDATERRARRRRSLQTRSADEGRTPDETVSYLEGQRRALRELDTGFGRSSLHRPMPEDDRTIAEAAYAAWTRSRDSALLEAAWRHAERARDAFPFDSRLNGLAVRLLRGGQDEVGSDPVALASLASNEAAALLTFGTFHRAATVRELRNQLRDRPEGVEKALALCDDALAAFDGAVARRFLPYESVLLST